MRLTPALLIAATLMSASCSRESESSPEVVGEIIDDERIRVVLKRTTVAKPVRVVIDRGAIHLFVVKDHPQAQPALCETNWERNTITVLVAYTKSEQTRTISVFLDGRSLGDWRFVDEPARKP